MTRYILNRDELSHHGILGQKWGIRRYQNFDGSYTKAGLERYNRSSAKYEQKKAEYKAIKKDKTKSRYEKQYAKGKMKEAKRQMNKDYKHLALDKKGDEGKVLYSKGMRITNNKQLAYNSIKAGSLMVTGSQYLKYAGYLDSKTADILSYTGVGLAALGNFKAAIDEIPNNKLRAYYSHTSNY